MATCKKCGAPVIWLKTPNGKWMIADEGLHRYRENKRGKDLVVNDRGMMIRCDLLSDEPNLKDQPTGLARIPHWATCPYAEEFHRKGGKEDVSA